MWPRNLRKGDSIRPATWNGLRVEFADEGAIFHRSIVIDTRRDEHEIPFALGGERREHVVDETEPWLLEIPVAGQLTLGVERLHDTTGRRHLNVGSQYSAVERIIGFSTHEAAERFDQRLKRPGACPCAHRIAQGGAVRGHIGDDDVFRITAVIRQRNTTLALGSILASASSSA